MKVTVCPDPLIGNRGQNYHTPDWGRRYEMSTSNLPERPQEEINILLTLPDQQYGQIVQIIREATSGEKIKQLVNDLEYPSFVVRAACKVWRFYDCSPWQSKRSEELERIRAFPENVDIEAMSERVFSCIYQHGGGVEDHDGSIVVIPHPFLPPVFWEYTLLDDVGEIIYSRHGRGDKYTLQQSTDWGVSCSLTQGSKSLPAGLSIHFVCELYELVTTFSVREYSLGRDTRTIPFWTKFTSLKDNEDHPIRYESTISHPESVRASADSVVFQKLTPEQKTLIVGDVFPGATWLLMLKTNLYAPIAGNQCFRFCLKTWYSIGASFLNSKRSLDTWTRAKAKKIGIASDLPGSRVTQRVFETWSPMVEQSGIRNQRIWSEAREIRESLEAEILEISQKTPDEIEIFTALWYYFGFRGRSDERIYNLYTTEEHYAKPNRFGVKEVRLSGEPLPPYDMFVKAEKNK